MNAPQTSKTMKLRLRRVLKKLAGRAWDPEDEAAARFLAKLLLLWEAVVCLIIILKVPCEFAGI